MAALHSGVDSCRLLKAARFGLRFFGSIQGFNIDDRGSEALIFMGHMHEDFRLSSTRSGRLQYSSSDSSASAARSGGDSGRSVVEGH